MGHGKFPSFDSRLSLPAPDARQLLGKLRDLDLRSASIALTPELSVRMQGCVSLDAPMGHSLHYRLHSPAHGDCNLEVGWEDGALRLVLRDVERRTLNQRDVPLLKDLEGRALAPDMAARMSPRSSSRREVEHFLRRVVRAAFPARSGGGDLSREAS